MLKCSKCIAVGYCIRVTAKLVSDRELDNPAFIRDLRSYTSNLPVTYRQWRDYIVNEYRDYGGWIAGHYGGETFLDMDVFETPNIDYWFRSFCCTPCADDTTPRLRNEVRERVRVLATILRARNPQVAMLWGRMDAANDNEPEE